MNPVLKEILDDVLEIQEEKLVKAKDERDNLEQAFRIAQEAFINRKERVQAIKDALNASTD